MFLFLALLFTSLIMILLPLADGIVLGLVFAYICRPINAKLKRWHRLGALIGTMFIVVPLVIIIGTGLVEIFRQIVYIIENQSEFIEMLFGFVRQYVPYAYSSRINELIWDSSISLLSIMGQLGFVSYAKGIAMFMLNLVVAVFVCYFILLEGENIHASFMKIVPAELSEPVGRYLRELDRIIGGIFIGNAYAALTVSIISVFVFYAFGFTHIPALATLIFIAAIVPLFAGYMVLLALALVRYFEMGFQPAIVFFIVSNLVIYGPPELILRPYFVSVRSQIHPVVLLVVFLGGGFVGGIAGFFSAPIILGMLIAAYRVYTGSITETVPDADPSPGGTG
jgi:predicted PurR-regulated permease PerM